MARSITPIVSAFEVPLTDKQLINLGRISAIWAQVDFFVDQLLMRVHDLAPQQMEILAGDKMVGSKLSMLEQSLHLVTDEPCRGAIVEFVKLANSAKVRRNHSAHGVWGWRVSEKSEFVAARHARTPGVPLRADKLKQLEREVAAASLAGQSAFNAWTGADLTPESKFHWGAKDEPPARLGSNTKSLPSGRPLPRRAAKAKRPSPKSSRA